MEIVGCAKIAKILTSCGEKVPLIDRVRYSQRNGIVSQIGISNEINCRMVYRNSLQVNTYVYRYTYIYINMFLYVYKYYVGTNETYR